MTKFEGSDWDAFAGAERPADGEPLICYADVEDWPEDLSEYGEGVVVIADASGIAVYGDEVHLFFECNFDSAKAITGLLPIKVSYRSLLALGFKQV